MKRFWSKVNKTESCWNWTAGSRGNGYGSFKHKGKVIDSHRMSWFLTHGEFPDLYVCHKCDNRKCVNPEHLFLGTHSDNMKDASKKGKLFKPCFKGEKGIASKLTNKQIEVILELSTNNDIKRRDLASNFGISTRYLRNLIAGNYRNYGYSGEDTLS